MLDRNQNPEVLNSFLDYSETILNKSPNTIKEYNYDLNTFLKFLKMHFHLTIENELSKITTKEITPDILKKVKLDDLYAYLSYLTREHHNKAASRARKVASIKAFFNYLTLRANLLEVNPAINLESPKIEKRLPKYLTLEDSEKLLNITSQEKDEENAIRDYAIITLFLNCGIRLAELIGINIGDIKFAEETMTVIGKGNKERIIYLNKACIKALKDYLEIRPKEGIKTDSEKALFLSKRKERISRRSVQYIVEKELKKAGLDASKYSVHKLRHTAATLMYQYGNVDIRALKELLGHESISTTELYTHISNEQVRNAVEDNPLSNVQK